MMTFRTHQASSYEPRNAAWQGCALDVVGVGRGSLPFQGFGRGNTQAICLVARDLKPGLTGPETSP